MRRRVLLAGASGVLGRSLVPLLRDAGHSLVAITRTVEGQARLQELGIQTIVADVYDRPRLEDAVAAVMPEVIIHQLTDLPDSATELTTEALIRNARIRREGTINLVNAARLVGIQRLIAQSIAWAYAPKAPPYLESDPLDLSATGQRAISVLEGVIPLESTVLKQNDFEGIVLRYGRFYGPGSWSGQPSGTSVVHVDAAAYAAFLAVDRGRAGVYNIADTGGDVSVALAQHELGWSPDFRRTVEL